MTMRRSPLFRLGLAVLAAALCAAGPAAPAHAAPDAGTLTGRLTNYAGKPVTQAAVNVYDDENYEFLTSSETDADGRFTVEGLPSADVKVQFNTGSFELWAGRTTEYEKATVFTVTEGGTTEVYEQLPAPALQGRLTNHADEPAAQAQVTIYDDQDYEYLVGVATDAEGHFEVAELPPGKVKVQFDYHGFERWAGGAAEYEKAKIFTIKAGAITTVADKLPALGIFEGRLVDQTGAPVPSTRVAARELENWDATDADTDEDGRWKLAVAPAEYTINFDIDGRRQWVKGTRDEQAAARFTIAAGQTVSVDETLLPTGTITGKLVDAKGKAVRNAQVSLKQDGDSVGNAETDEDGQYTFERVFAGTYKMLFEPPKAPAQWAYGKSTEASATPIVVAAGEVTSVNEKLVVLGTVSGRFTTTKNKGIAKATVVVSPAEDGEFGDQGLTAKTDSKGRFKVTGVLPGVYKVSFTDRTKRTQYAHGKGTWTAGKVFTVKSGKTTTVNDKQVAPATLRITAVDAKTGKKLPGFCASVSVRSDDEYCTKDSVVVIKNLPAATLDVSINLPSKSLYLNRWDLRAKTAVGKTTKLTAKLQLGGAIKTTVVDRGTGRAVKDTCFAVVVPGHGGLPDGYGDCTDAKGKSQTRPLMPGTYNMFVIPRGKLGQQWLGKSGGTGDQRKAAKVTVRAGKVVAAPTVKLDKAGTIAGTITAPDGKPVTRGDASISAWHYRVGASFGDDLDRQGRYTLDGLGPYRWPLVFTTYNGRQWSGGKGNRYAATTIQVIAGKTVAHNEAMHGQSRLTGKVTVRTGTLKDGFLMAHTASTGDPVGDIWFWADGKFTMLVPSGEQVKIEYYVDAGKQDELTGWYDGAKTLEKAKIVAVPDSGAKTLNVRAG
jgi:5-hydroxyisourate hydrolase-like protein (transthyretin family)